MMKFHLDTAETFIPDGAPEVDALARTTHLSIAAHQDDIEIMAVTPIIECFQQPDKWFSGVVVTDGRGSPRAGIYENLDDEEMRLLRFKEQKKAAVVGEFSAQILLDIPSRILKDSTQQAPVDDLVALLKATRPQYVYTHNLADKHDTHIAVTLRTLEAIRQLPPEERPEKVYGCEVWRDLDWMVDSDKIGFDASAHENLQAALIGVFDSQIAGGKRYDLATMGRRRANATYFQPHGVDTTTGVVYGMDLTPLVEDSEKDIAEYVMSFVERFSHDVADRLNRIS
jgi:LmbE family N-acetylglucosaminyl deacetylase